MKIIAFDETQELADLVRLRLPVHFLEVYQLRNAWMREDLVASFLAHRTESERFNQPDKIRIADIPKRSAGNSSN